MSELTPEELFEVNFDIFNVTGMPWNDIKGLDDVDRKGFYDKALEAKQRMIDKQAEKVAFYASQGLDEHGQPLKEKG